MGPMGRSLPTSPVRPGWGQSSKKSQQWDDSAEAFAAQPWMHHTQGTPLWVASHLVLGGEWESVDRNRLSECSASLQQRG